MSLASQPLVLFDNPVSPYARKVRIALREKGAPFEVRPVESRVDREALLRLNPRGEVPTLLVGDRAVAGSEIICELLDELHPEPPLLPHDPLQRAAARGLERFCDEHLDALQFLGSLADRAQMPAGSERALAAHLADLRVRCFDPLEGALGDRPHLVGDTVSIADVAAAAHLVAIRFLGRGPGPEHPRLAAWLDRMAARDSVRRSSAEAARAFARSAELGADAVFAPPITWRGSRIEAAIRAGLGRWLLDEIESARARLPPLAPSAR